MKTRATLKRELLITFYMHVQPRKVSRWERIKKEFINRLKG